MMPEQTTGADETFSLITPNEYRNARIRPDNIETSQGWTQFIVQCSQWLDQIQSGGQNHVVGRQACALNATVAR